MNQKLLGNAVVVAAVAAAVAVVAAVGSNAGAQRRGHDPSIARGIECSACHTPSGWGVTAGVSGGAGFDHADTGFPLTGRHGRVACNGCHQAERQTRRDCTTCHEDPHQRRLGQSCDRCHSARGWNRTRAVDMHRLTRLPLTGMHVLAACTDCHTRTSEREYSATPAECYACHEREYRDSTVHPNHDGTAGGTPFPRDCAACHRANSWSPAFVDPTVLSRSSPLTAPRSHDMRFPVSFGAHSGAPCQSCHLSQRVPAAVACTGCHVHSPLILRRQHPTQTVSSSGAACLSCHPGGRAR
ncbi:MAG: hypothetical protein JRH11_02320 [Deltaproteobacteria bacterium]|nr:hypothetical protein [Deltaproteobacteria bacterium]